MIETVAGMAHLYGDNVEAHFFVAIVFQHIGVGQPDIGTLLVAGDEIFRIAMSLRGACLDLYKDDEPLPVGDNVDFVFPFAPVGLQYGEALFDEVLLSQLFPQIAYVVMFSHKYVFILILQKYNYFLYFCKMMHEPTERRPLGATIHRLWCAAPMLRVALALMVGILLAEVFPSVPMSAWLVTAAAGLAALVVTAAVRRLRKDFFYLPMLWMSVTALGALLTVRLAPADPFLSLSQQMLMQVRLTDTPRPTPKCFKVPVEVEAVCDSGNWHSVTGGMMLFLRQSRSSSELRYGDRIVLCASPQHPAESVGEDGFNYRRYLRRKGMLWQCFADSTRWRLVAAADTGRHSVVQWSKRMQLALVQRIRRSQLTPSQQGMAEALLLGWKTDLDEQTQQQFRTAGITHLLCVSGLHVGIVAWLAGLIFVGWCWRRWQRMLKGFVQIACVWIFVMLTGMAPSTLRAGVMFTLLIVGSMLGRKKYLLNNLATSAVLLLCVSPWVLFDIGFQLSYAAVLGIAAWHRPLQQLIVFPSRWWWQPMHRLWDLVCLSTSAQLATLPLTLYYFHQFPTYFLVANIVIVPFAGLLLGTVLLLVVVAGWPWGCDLAALLLRWELVAADAVTRWVASLPCALMENIYFDLPRALITAFLLLCFTVLLRCKL